MSNNNSNACLYKAPIMTLITCITCKQQSLCLDSSSDSAVLHSPHSDPSSGTEDQPPPPPADKCNSEHRQHSGEILRTAAEEYEEWACVPPASLFPPGIWLSWLLYQPPTRLHASPALPPLSAALQSTITHILPVKVWTHLTECVCVI